MLAHTSLDYIHIYRGMTHCANRMMVKQKRENDVSHLWKCMTTVCSVELLFYHLIHRDFCISSFMHFFFRTTFSEFAAKHARDTRFKAIEKMKDREAIFTEFMTSLRKKEKENSKNRGEKVSMIPIFHYGSFEGIDRLFSSWNYVWTLKTGMTWISPSPEALALGVS